jgi:hypothetical protein
LGGKKQNKGKEGEKDQIWLANPAMIHVVAGDDTRKEGEL